VSIAQRTVSDDEADIRLDRWFRRHFPGLSQASIQKFCRTGQVRVDGKRVEAATRLAPGQAVRIPPMPKAMPQEARLVPEADPKVRQELEALILYRDEHILVLNKPHGLPVQGGPGITRHLDGMLDSLRLGSTHRPRLVHRLDRDTSGVILLARTPGVAAKLAALFRGRDIEKTYWAVVVGRPLPVEGRIDLPLIRVGGLRGERTAPASRDDKNAAHAITDYETLDNAGQKFAWLQLHPRTGRTHQLRVHCHALGTPILGDIKYATPDHMGTGAATVEGLPTQLHLHARGLVFPHPAGGTLLVEAPLPPHMAETFRTLGFTAPPPRPARLNKAGLSR